MKLVHPLKTRAIVSAKIKNDKIDSRVLAHLLRADLLHLSYVPERRVRLQREVLRYRASLVKIQTSIKNHIHIILAKNNINHDFSDLFGKKGIMFLRTLSLHETYRMALDGYLSVLGVLEQEIDAASRRIQTLVKDDEQAKLLMTIPGVGHYGALLVQILGGLDKGMPICIKAIVDK